MTWNTPLGHRTLAGKERLVFAVALSEMTQELLGDIFEDNLTVGIPVFDAMSGCQQLVMLDFVRKYLFEDTPESNPLSAVVEGTAAAIVQYIEGQVDFELDIDRERKTDASIRPIRRWRKLLLSLCRALEWDVNPKKGQDECQLAMDLLHDQILHDIDYLDEMADEPPEVGLGVNKLLGIPEDYYRGIPVVEPDGPGMVEVIRRLLSQGV